MLGCNFNTQTTKERTLKNFIVCSFTPPSWPKRVWHPVTLKDEEELRTAYREKGLYSIIEEEFVKLSGTYTQAEANEICERENKR
jgi:hypothetical protein